MSDDNIHAEATPGGGVRIQGGGIELRVSREAIERSEREGGLGFNYALTPMLHESLSPIEGEESPIDGYHDFMVHLMPKKGGSDDEN